MTGLCVDTEVWFGDIAWVVLKRVKDVFRTAFYDRIRIGLSALIGLTTLRKTYLHIQIRSFLDYTVHEVVMSCKSTQQFVDAVQRMRNPRLVLMRDLNNTLCLYALDGSLFELPLFQSTILFPKKRTTFWNCLGDGVF